MLRIPYLAELLDDSVCGYFLGRFRYPITAIAGWGHKSTAAKPRQYAKQNGLPYLAVEDGFLRSVGLGDQDFPLSVVVDDIGIYYDATSPSRLDLLIAHEISEEDRRRARALMRAWCDGRVSKYNHLREYRGELPRHYVLVVDQTYDDASVTLGSAGSASFGRMLQSALEDYPDCAIILKVHPDVFAGRKRGYFDPSGEVFDPRVLVLTENVHPVRLLDSALAVYTVTSQLGFEALLRNRPVHTFGMPFYAGWGLTNDEMPRPNHRSDVTLEQLVYASLIAYPRYMDPETGERCEVEVLLSHIALQRKMRERFPQHVCAESFSLYKRSVLRSYLQGSEIHFVRERGAAPDGSAVMVWGRADRSDSERGIHLISLEDGFLRSVGLGADLIKPVSWVFDCKGIYFDSTCPSDIEDILQGHDFDDATISRAKALRERIVSEGLTKYNIGASGGQNTAFSIPEISGGECSVRNVILVPGQVEADASIAFGAPDICTNLELLRAVGLENPDAYVIYKPHPDVVAGLRQSGSGESLATQYCDNVLVDVSMNELLTMIDEVHTLTSLTGFEALLRGKSVVCYGLPFYAGWGLTTDKISVSRRTRKLGVDELVAGALIIYPTYISRKTGRFTTPERALAELCAWRNSAACKLSWWGYMYRIIVKYLLRRP